MNPAQPARASYGLQFEQCLGTVQRTRAGVEEPVRVRRLDRLQQPECSAAVARGQPWSNSEPIQDIDKNALSLGRIGQLLQL